MRAARARSARGIRPRRDAPTAGACPAAPRRARAALPARARPYRERASAGCASASSSYSAPALGVQRQERLALARQRALGAPSAPRAATRSQASSRIDVEQHGQMRLERRAHALGEDAAAAQRDHRPAPALAAARTRAPPRRPGTTASPLELELARRRDARSARPAARRCRAPSTPERRRQLARRGRLAGAHEADQDVAPSDPLARRRGRPRARRRCGRRRTSAGRRRRARARPSPRRRRRRRGRCRSRCARAAPAPARGSRCRPSAAAW